MKQLILLIFFLLGSTATNAQGWGQTQKIVPDDRGGIGDFFGWSVAIQQDIAAIGAKSVNGSSSDEGAVYMYIKDASDNWIQTQKLFSANPRQFDSFGSSVDIDGNFMIIGARGQDYDEYGNNFENAAGAAYIFEKDGANNWSQIQKIVASDRGATLQPVFGETVAISGDYAVVNAPREDTGLDGQPNLDAAGACYIFERDGNGVWNEVQKIVASDRNAFDYFGEFTTTISGDIIAVGSFYQDYDASGQNVLSSAGAVYIFERDANGVWNQVQKIVASDREQGEWFGKSVALEGNTLIVGASQEYVAGNTDAQYGAAYVFERDGNGIYNEIQKIIPDYLEHQSKFGHVLDMDGNNLVIGAYSMNIGSILSGGAAFMFEKDGTGLWNQVATMYDPNASLDDFFGFDVAVSGDYSMVGAYQEDEDVDGMNFIQEAGSVYIFDANVPSTLSVTENNLESNIKVYPNPIQDELIIKLKDTREHIGLSIVNQLGQKVLNKTFHSAPQIKLNVTDFKSGLYIVRLTRDVESIQTFKIIKN